MSIQPYEESVPGTPGIVPEIDFLRNSATMFVLSMIMASVLVAPVILATTQASTMWRLFKKM